MLSVIIFTHCINYGIHFEVFVFLLLLNFLCLSFSYFSFSFSQCSPQSSNPTAATTVKRLELLPGVTTLVRDFTGGLSLVPLITYSF